MWFSAKQKLDGFKFENYKMKTDINISMLIFISVLQIKTIINHICI